MENIQEIDTVLQHVRQAARRFGVSADAVITQQILLLGDAFYGYRFTATGFAAIWSAVDQMVKVYDREEQLLAVFSPTETAGETSAGIISLPSLQRRAA